MPTDSSPRRASRGLTEALRRTLPRFTSSHLRLATVALLALAAARAHAATYHLVADTTTNVGADGTCNLPSGNTTNGVYRTTMRTGAPGGTSTQLRNAISGTIFASLGRVYAAPYSSATAVSSPSATLWLRSTSTNDQWQLLVKDYDPAGAAGNGVTIFTSNVVNTTNTGSAASASFTFTGTGLTVPANHRLLLEVFFKPASSGNTGRVYLNATATDSTLAITETVGGGTITLGDGTAPANATVCAATGTATYIDHFTLLASGATSVTGITTSFTPALPAGLLSLLEVTNAAGAAQGSLANPSGGSPAVTGLSFAAPTGSAAEYRLRITPQSASSASGSFTATVTNVGTSGGFTVAGSDPSSATIVVDGAPSPIVTGATATGGTGTVTANWTNPGTGAVPATDFGGYVVVLGNTVPTTGAPAKGTAAYAAGAAVGSDTVVCSGGIATCAKTGLSSGQTYHLTIFTRDGCANWSSGVSVTAAAAGTPPTPTEGNPDPAAPMVSILNPVRGVVSGAFKVQIRVFNPGVGIAGVTAVRLSLDDGVTWPFTGTRNANYDAPNAATFEVVVPEPTPGKYTLRAQATNAVPLTTNTGPVPVTARPDRVGDGNLLVRDNSSQLCSDCHAGIKTHSSETAGTKYGAWATGCRDCHQPHSTRNIELIAETVTPPAVNGAQAPRHMGFTTRTGDSGAAGWDAANNRPTATASYANSDNLGPCQVCHTRTVDPNAPAPQPARWRNTGNADDAHYAATGANGTAPCASCHSHRDGFAAGEPGAPGSKCGGCHASIFAMVKTGGQASAHRIDLDQSGDTTLDWTTATSLGSVPSTQRSCLNTCHGDHPHDLTSPATATHQGNLYADSSTNASRGAAAVARVGPGGTGTVNRATTDFDPATNAGMCVKCHEKPIATGGLTVSAATFGSSAHDYTSNAFGTWTYPLHDGSTFARNCTKCHASRAEGKTPAYGSTATRGLQTVHGSADAGLLAGVLNPATVNGTVDAARRASFVCYNCHGNATVGADLSGKDIQSQVNHANNTAPQSGHPSDEDAVHADQAEYADATFGAGLGAGVARHAACQDCHDSHAAKAGTHAVTTNLAGPPLEGSWGAQLSSNPTFWTAPAAGNFTKKRIAAGTDVEATLCFKCHSSWYGTLPSSPSGGYTETDQAREFNPANAGSWATSGTANAWSSGETAGGFHPVLASAGGNLGQVNMANLVTTNFAWRTTGARNLMTCTDCHESDVTTDPNGPHGSAAGFILRGPNTLWNGTMAATSSGMPAGAFCANCHSSTYANSRFANTNHTSRSNHRVSCWNCHARVPHGGPRPGILVAPAGAATGVGGTIAGWDTTAPYWGLTTSSGKLYLASYPSNATAQWSQNNCGCNGTGH